MRLLCVPLLLVACATESDDPLPGDGPTWHQEVAPVVMTHCGSCHTADGLGEPLRFDTYEEAKNFGPLMAAAVEARDMPPFKAADTAECTPDYPWMHDKRLTDQEIGLITGWVAAGMPEGDPTSAADLQPPADPGLEGPTRSLLPGESFTVPPVGDTTDIFTCISLDPGLTEDGFLEAYRVLPDDPRVVHHVLVGIDNDGNSAALADGQGFYDCLGGFGQGVGAQFVGGWVPGSAPVEMPEGSAVRVPAGARIVLQMHYHQVEEAVPDATGLEIRWADGAPELEARFGLFGNRRGVQPDPEDEGRARLFIPAGATDHTEHLIIPWTTDASRLFTIGNHMHYIGTRMRVWVERPDASQACLLDTPKWDFDWQQTFFYDATASQAPVLNPGDELHIECTYDNSLDNPGVRKVLDEAGLEEPVDVSVGEGSLDEMCLAILGVIPVAIEPTHEGRATLEVRTGDGGVDDRCSADVELQVDAQTGIIDGSASCEVEAFNQTRLLTARWTTNAWDGGEAASGEGSFSLEGFPTGAANWSASVREPAFSATMENTYSGLDLTVRATVEAERN